MSAHKTFSFIKSGFRLIGCGLGIVAFSIYIPQPLAMHAFGFLFIAELWGILEEKFEAPKPVERWREVRDIIRKAGAEYHGFDMICASKILFKNLTTGSILSMPEWEVTPERVRERLEEDVAMLGQGGM